MPATFLSGDLFHHPGLPALAHGCNCAGAMGRGIAVEFRRRYPRMFAAYRERCSEGRFGLGDVFPWTEAGITVFNLGTQQHWKTRAELPAVERALRELVRQAEAAGLPRVGLPRIGAGLGGLDWAEVRGLLERVGAGTAVELVVFEEYAPAAKVGAD